MIACSSPVARASAASQSTGEPSASDSASGSSDARSDIATFHLLCEPQEGPAGRHARRGGGWFAEGPRHVVVAALHLDARDDRFAVFGSQPRERRFIPFDRFFADGQIERRGGVVLCVVV